MNANERSDKFSENSFEETLQALRKFHITSPTRRKGKAVQRATRAKKSLLCSPRSKSPVSRQTTPSHSLQVMDRRSLFGTPPRGPAADAARYGPQDARGGLAVQPAAAPAKINLKKPTVKVVGPSASPRTTPEPVKPAFKAEDGKEAPKPVSKLNPKAAPVTFMTKAESMDATEATLDAMYARLNSSRSTTSPSPRPVGSSQASFVSAKMQTPESQPTKLTGADVLKRYMGDSSQRALETKSSPTAFEPSSLVNQLRSLDLDKLKNSETDETKLAGSSEPFAPVPAVAASTSTDQMHPSLKAAIDVTRSFMAKAYEFIGMLPGIGGVAALQQAIDILRRVYAAGEKADPGYARAAATYCNSLGNSDVDVPAAWFDHVLTDSNGDFFKLFVMLVNKKVISVGLLGVDNKERLDHCGKAFDLNELGELHEVVGLCRAIVDFHVKHTTTISTAKTEAKPVSNDPMDKAAAWPAQEKRVNIPECRTCILKNVPSSASTHQIQGLVWGGNLESITRTDPESSYVVVKFLTAAACDKFFKATANGIVVPGKESDKNAIITVEKQPGPNSANDLINNCIANGMTRCVRAYNPDDDWQYPALLRLARQGGTSAKRDVDCIFKDKNEKGRHFIEFRFGSIYHALNFRRFLQDEEDWEHCSLVYAPDPCERAGGVHIIGDQKAESVKTSSLGNSN